MIDLVFFLKKFFFKLHFSLYLTDDVFLTPGKEKEIINLGWGAQREKKVISNYFPFPGLKKLIH